MKNRFIYLAVPAIFLMAACSKTGDTQTEATASPTADTAIPTADTVDTVASADTVPAIVNTPFEIKKFQKKVGDNELQIDYPIEGNPELVKHVREWINEKLTGTYRGNLAKADAFFKHYASELGKDEELEEFGGFIVDKFDLKEVNDKFVTYDYTSYLYEGGAHGSGGTYGTSFLQSDGSLFNKKCIKSYNSLRPLFVDGLKKYFKVKSDAQLKQELSPGISLKSLPAPGMEPWVTTEGVTFSYTPYEIGPYSAGSPQFTIPFSVIEPYLTDKGKKFLPN